jgi:polyphosphate kinase
VTSPLPEPPSEHGFKGGAAGALEPHLYLDRELSWVAFNQRVLEEAQDARNPLLERVKFLAICASNLDEFFMIRVSALQKQIDAGLTHRAPSGMTPAEQYVALRSAVLPHLAACQRLLQDDLLPALRRAGIAILPYKALDADQHALLQRYFQQEVFPVLTPLAVDASHPFPFVANLFVNLLVVLSDPPHGQVYARVKLPEGLPRLVPVPPTPPTMEAAVLGQAPAQAFVWLDELIAGHLADLFPGKQVMEVSAFRVTRDTDLAIQEDESADLLEMVEEGVRQRRFGAVVRLEVEASASAAVRAWLAAHFEVAPEEVYDLDGPLMLSSLLDLYDLPRPDLKYAPFAPQVPLPLRSAPDLFAGIRRQPLLLHHPFDSFTPLVDLVRRAAHDPAVLAIKQTLYRVGRDSPLVPALLEARDEGKQVAVVVELRARFDEENNIEWARALEAAGVHVVYGTPERKVHAKLLAIVRREEAGLRRYVHIGTGNYNPATALVYTDFGLLTADEAVGADVGELFNVLTGYSDQTVYRKLLVSPLGVREALLGKIEREIAHQRHAGDGRLIFKVNAVTDETMIGALYRAAQAGVRIDLLVRGICSLRPGVPGVSETIRVRSLVGRFLEHGRVYYFHNGGQEEIYLGSADLMERNFARRVEVLVPIEEAHLKRYLHDTVLETYLQDNTQARELLSDGTYVRLTPGTGPAVSAQQAFLDMQWV